jgi:BirA family biotin operon repressor/biotin-[acetyl-CoA-carboxylase] ligase
VPLPDLLTPEHVEPLLRGRLGRPYRFVAQAESTQRLVAADDPEGALVVADEQTAGRGRLGRSWEAPPGTAILCSLVLEPPVPSERLPELMVVAARAVAGAVAAETSLAPTVKFPNDVLVDGRKLAGILAEAADGRVVLGMGINVGQTAAELPTRAVFPATSLRVETGEAMPRAPLLAAILLELEREYDAWVSDAGARG